jgi:hypothetical protein
LISAPNLSKHLTTSQLLWDDATNNGDCPQLLRKLIPAPALSKHSTTSLCPCFDDINNISLVFGSDVMENGRMLSLGCYSNTSDMVELILEYVDPKCIDIDFTSNFASWMNARSANTHVTPLIVACSRGNVGIVQANI